MASLPACLYVYCLCLSALLTFVSRVSSQWQQGTPTMPVAERMTAIGYNDLTNTLSILGGWSSYEIEKQDLTEINLTDLSMTRTTNTSFSGYDIFGYSQFYTQINHLLYVINTAGSNLHAYNLDDKAFSANLAFSNMDTTVSSFGCLASSAANAELYVLGGRDSSANPIATFQVYSISNDTWTTGPNMLSPRWYHACIANQVSCTLFAIGGVVDSSLYYNTTNTVEVIDTSNILNNAWSYTQNNLSVALYGLRAVIVQQEVYVIGGGVDRPTSATSTDLVHVIHADHTISVHPDRLAVAVRYTNAVAVQNTLYAFGGLDVYSLTSWQSLDLPTTAPTSSPSGIPSKAPTATPSENPTTSTPTQIPSKTPTATPSEHSSIPPSTAPIKEGEGEVDDAEQGEDSDTDSAQQSEPRNSAAVGTYIGFACGVLVGCAMMVVGYVVFKRRKQKNEENEMKNAGQTDANAANVELETLRPKNVDEDVVQHIIDTHGGANGNEDVVEQINANHATNAGEDDHATSGDQMEGDEFEVAGDTEQ